MKEKPKEPPLKRKLVFMEMVTLLQQVQAWNHGSILPPPSSEFLKNVDKALERAAKVWGETNEQENR